MKKPPSAAGGGEEVEYYVLLSIGLLLCVFINITAAGYITLRMTIFLLEKMKELETNSFERKG
uniref:Uncharacterized protein n=1 Tax=Caudovirales sp. ctkvU4 TaxID=2826783 RepID=A0A8S5QQ98_9CAUD|nr:MAG TPA: hypothetical protein [Caudovirales sp. ctkvU4]